MIDQFDLTDDQRAVQEMAQRFTADSITPFAARWDEEHILPRDGHRVRTPPVQRLVRDGQGRGHERICGQASRRVDRELN